MVQLEGSICYRARGGAGEGIFTRSRRRGFTCLHLGATILSAFPAMTPQRHGAQTVLTGLPDHSALYGVLAVIGTLGLDLLEVRQLSGDLDEP